MGRGHDTLKEKNNFLTINGDIRTIMIAPKTRESKTRFNPLSASVALI